MLLSSFVPLQDVDIAVPPDAGVPAGYLDGAERYLHDVLLAASDRSVASGELKQHIRDWPSLYHLTPYRSTIFDCLGLSAGDARVLELGCGCGAITRWLGEHCGEVHAVEGSVDRARVARARTADLDNVHLYSANYSQLTETASFDIATLIGVLEYGHLYHPDTNDPEEAALDNLRIVRRALREDGFLVLAIENQLGLKYLAGALEDHSSKPFDSINGYPLGETAVTFSAKRLQGLLDQAGFAHADWYVPFPDYKLATTIVDSQVATDDDRIYNWLQGTAPDRGRHARSIQTFHETLATREIDRAGLLKDLANSFLVVAYAGDPAAAQARHGLETGWTARHYSLDRAVGRRKRATLWSEQGEVRHEPAFPADAAAPALEGPFAHTLRTEPFHRGDLFLREILTDVAGKGVGAEALAHVREHARWLVSEYGTGGVDELGVALLRGDAMDALWWNTVVGEDGEWHAIDGEWTFAGTLPADFVVWRSLVHFAVRFANHLPQKLREGGAHGFAAALLEHACSKRRADRFATFAAVDGAFGLVATGEPYDEPPALAAWAAATPRRAVVAWADEIAAHPTALRDFASAYGPHDPVTLVLVPPAEGADEALRALGAALDGCGVADVDQPDLLLLDADALDDPTIAGGISVLLSDREAPASLAHAEHTPLGSAVALAA